MVQNIESVMRAKAKGIKRKTLGLCGKVSFKTEQEFSAILESLGIFPGSVKSIPDSLNLGYATPLGNCFLNIRRYTHPNPSVEDPYIYRIKLL